MFHDYQNSFFPSVFYLLLPTLFLFRLRLHFNFSFRLDFFASIPYPFLFYYSLFEFSLICPFIFFFRVSFIWFSPNDSRNLHFFHLLLHNSFFVLTFVFVWSVRQKGSREDKKLPCLELVQAAKTRGKGTHSSTIRNVAERKTTSDDWNYIL